VLRGPVHADEIPVTINGQINCANSVNAITITRGGGNSTRTTTNYACTNGSSGIVIIRYSNTLPDAVNTTGSPTLTNVSGYKIYTFTGSGCITF